MKAETLGTLHLDSLMEGCEVGESKELTLTVTVTKNDEGGLDADVTEVSGYGGEEEEGEEKPSEEAMPPKGKVPAAIVIAMGKK